MLDSSGLTLRNTNKYAKQTPEDIYKSHLAESGGVSRRRDGGAQQVDSARANLASTFVNAFVNAGYGQDKVRYGIVYGTRARRL